MSEIHLRAGCLGTVPCTWAVQAEDTFSHLLPMPGEVVTVARIRKAGSCALSAGSMLGLH